MARNSKQAAIARTTNSEGWKFFEDDYIRERIETLQRDILKDDQNVDKIRGQITELVEVLNWAEERKQYKI